jgi:hypothetical protein
MGARTIDISLPLGKPVAGQGCAVPQGLRLGVSPRIARSDLLSMKNPASPFWRNRSPYDADEVARASPAEMRMKRLVWFPAAAFNPGAALANSAGVAAQPPLH